MENDDFVQPHVHGIVVSFFLNSAPRWIWFSAMLQEDLISSLWLAMLHNYGRHVP